MKIVLFQPEIAGNTGSIGRTCVALNLELILIRPYGFDLDEKKVRRAGLDYWKHVQLKEFDDWSQFIDQENPQELFLFTKNATTLYYNQAYSPRSYLVFGPETRGLPPEILSAHPHHHVKLPMFSSKIRSLNLANCVTAAAYEGARCQMV